MAQLLANPDIVAAVLAALDLPTQARCCSVSTHFMSPQTIAAASKFAAGAVEHLTCPICYASPSIAASALPAQQFLRAAGEIWHLVAEPLLLLDRTVFECPGLMGDTLARVYILGQRKHHRLTESWWRPRLVGREDPPAEPSILERILRERGMSENVLVAMSELNHPCPDIDLAMAILGGGDWSFHWFPVRFDFEFEELQEAQAVLTFDVYGVSGLIYFQEFDAPGTG